MIDKYFISNKKVLISTFLIPLLFGLWSVFLGQDRNADLANYHIYNAFSFIENKSSIDFGVAGIQSFFNPLLDLPYFILIKNFPGPFVSFIMGSLNGLNYIFLLLITKEFISFEKNKENILIFLALSGCLTGNFLAGLGNSMGDNLTSSINLLAILITIKYWETISSFKKKISKLSLIVSGIFTGSATALKLTNIPFAIAFGLSLLMSLSCSNFKKIKITFLFGLGVILGILIFGGFWYLRMWEQYQNPIFPLYSNIFKNAYISSNERFASDPWGAKNLFEVVLFPYISALDYSKAGRGLIHQFLWPLIYSLILVICWLHITNIFKKIKNNHIENIKSREKFLLFYIGFGYLIWMFLFSSQRYLVTLEILAPLCIYILINKFKGLPNKWSITKYILYLSIFITLMGGFGTWGHSSFTSPNLYAQTPEIKNPEKDIVLMSDESSIGWIVTMFSPKLAFYRLSMFPDNTSKLQKLLSERKGEVYTIISAQYNWRIDNVKKWSSIMSSLGFLKDDISCKKVQLLIEKIKYKGKIEYANNGSDICFIGLKDSKDYDENYSNEIRLSNANDILIKNGFKINKTSCSVYKANIGGQNWRYLWCPVNKLF